MTKTSTGRKPKYDYSDKMFLLEVEGYARDGLDDQHIAKQLDLDPTWFSKKKKEFPQITQALSRGRRPLNVIVENSLFKRATGGVTTKKTIVTKKREWNPEKESYETVVYESEEITELPPDVKAQDLWLRARKPDTWNTKQGVDHTTNGKDVNASPLLFMSASELSDDQLQEYIKKNIDSEDVSDND